MKWKTGGCSVCGAWIGIEVLTAKETKLAKKQDEIANRTNYRANPHHQQVKTMCSFCAYLHGQNSPREKETC
jgi:hypothetical protein